MGKIKGRRLSTSLWLRNQDPSRHGPALCSEQEGVQRRGWEPHRPRCHPSPVTSRGGTLQSLIYIRLSGGRHATYTLHITQSVPEDMEESKQQKGAFDWKKLNPLLNSSLVKLKAKTKGYKFLTAGTLRGMIWSFCFETMRTRFPGLAFTFCCRDMDKGWRYLSETISNLNTSHSGGEGPFSSDLFPLYLFTHRVPCLSSSL